MMNHLHSPPPESRKRRQARAHLLDVPSEVLLEHLLPRLDVKDLLHLSGASKLLHRLCNDERTWGRLCLRDYHNANLPELLAAKTIPNKKFYAGLKHARVSVWGSTDHGRLGLDLNPPLGGRTWRYRRYIASPQELAIDGKAGRTWHQGLLGSLTRLAPVSSGGGPEDDQAPPPAIDPIPREELGSVVSLVAGLTSFAALTSTGKVIVWGQLDGGVYGFREEDWSSKFTPVPEPTVLPLPVKAVSIALDCSHLTILDEDNIVWDLPAFGRAYHHASPLMCAPATPGNKSTPPYIAQIANGASGSACLTTDGKIIHWMMNDLGTGFDAASLIRTDNPYAHELRQLRWGKACPNESELPPLPTRNEAEWEDDPDGRYRRRDDERWIGHGQAQAVNGTSSGEQVVQIEYWVWNIVARKANGEVWFFHHDQWNYAPGISYPGLRDLGTRDTHDVTDLKLASCTSTTVWETNEQSALQASTLIQGFGDAPLIKLERSGSHYVALTQRGELYTWGDRNDAGQLGLGTTDTINTPTRVNFGQAAGMAIVVDMSAGSEHSGAIVLGDVDVGNVGFKDSSDELSSTATLRLRGGAPDSEDAHSEVQDVFDDRAESDRRDESATGGPESTIRDRRDRPWVELPAGPKRQGQAGTGPTATGASGASEARTSELPSAAEGPGDTPGQGSRQSAGGVGNHPSPAAALRAPAFRIGFAGRHALQQGQRQANDGHDTQEQGVGNHPQAGPGGALFRVGFAGRGRVRPQSDGPERDGDGNRNE